MAMKSLAVLVALCGVCQALEYKHLYPFDPETDPRLPNGDSVSSPVFMLGIPIVFYKDNFDGVAIHSDGFVTLEGSAEDGEVTKEAVVAPFMFDLDSSSQGNVYYQELTDENVLTRATGDVHRALENSAADFSAVSVFVATWHKLQSASHPGANFTFQCVIPTDGTSSYAIFLYPHDDFAVAFESQEELRDDLTGRAGFNNGGRDLLEVLSAKELLKRGNARAPGEWIFQIGGGTVTNEDRQPLHHVKEEAQLHRRQSGFEISEVNFGDDYNVEGDADCSDLGCDGEHGTCAAFNGGYCCQCEEGYFGNGATCIEQERAVRYNGVVSGYSIIIHSDFNWSNHSADNVDLHSYVVTRDGRTFSVMNGAMSPVLSRALKPMVIFSTTLGWMFASTSGGAINGFQYTGGKITSDTYMRYTSGKYEFRIRQIYDEVAEDESGEGKVIKGRMEFSGRLPAIEEGQEVKIDPFTQVYTKSGPGAVRSEGIHAYQVDNETLEYSFDQRIRFEGCEPSFEGIPTQLEVAVNRIYIEFDGPEANLRYAMNNHISAHESETEPETDPDRDESVGVRPTESTPAPVEPVEPVQPVEPEAPIYRTVCERQFAEALQHRDENPELGDRIFFPTCTDIGTFAPRQCTIYDAVCWCVDEDTGEEIRGTRTPPQEGYDLDCSDVRPPPPVLTPCEEDRANAEEAQNQGGSAANSNYMPRCMESGAYHPLQQLPDGSFMCVDFDGEELFRSTETPECMTSCQLQSYIAETNNIFRGTSHFVVRCRENGEFNPEQCVEHYCYCVDVNGYEVANSRQETTIPGIEIRLECDGPVIPEIVVPAPVPTDEEVIPPVVITEAPVQPVPQVGKLIFAQSMGINVVPLPVSRETKARRLFARSDQTAVALAYNCANQVYYWTDVSKRVIYSSKLGGDGSRSVVVNDRIRSPEGISVDFLSGNLYWTDSEYDRIEVSHADGSNRMTVVSGDMTNPRGIVVDPFRGRMYWTDWNRSAPKVWVADMDGSNKQVLVSEDLGLPNDITIDFYRQQVCFVDAGTKRVDCLHLDGSSRQTIYTFPSSPVQHPFGLAIDGDILFYSTWRGSKVIHAVNWRTGEDIPISGPRGAHGQMYGVEVVHPQCPRGNNYCQNNNGGCSHLCLPVPGGRVCKCPPTAVNCQ